MISIRESSRETRELILKSAEQIFLEEGYPKASMRKIAARAGITAGAIYKHFSGKEEMFGEIFEASGRKLMKITEAMMEVDFASMSDDALIAVLDSRISGQTLDLLQGDMRLFHMLLNNDSGICMERFRSTYIERCTEFAMHYYAELHHRGITSGTLSEKTISMMSAAEFSMICEMIADDSCRDGITQEMKAAFTEAMNILEHGIKESLGIHSDQGGENR